MHSMVLSKRKGDYIEQILACDTKQDVDCELWISNLTLERQNVLTIRSAGLLGKSVAKE